MSVPVPCISMFSDSAFAANLANKGKCIKSLVTPMQYALFFKRNYSVLSRGNITKYLNRFHTTIKN